MCGIMTKNEQPYWANVIPSLGKLICKHKRKKETEKMLGILKIQSMQDFTTMYVWTYDECMQIQGREEAQKMETS